MPENKPTKKRKRTLRKKLARKIELELTARPPVHEAVEALGALMVDVANLFEGTEKMLFANALHEIAVKIAADEAGFEVDEHHPSKAIGRLLKAINETAAETGKPHDTIVIEMLGKMGKHGVEHWN